MALRGQSRSAKAVRNQRLMLLAIVALPAVVAGGLIYDHFCPYRGTSTRSFREPADPRAGPTHAPTPAPIRQPQWTEIARWSGNGCKSTETFTVGSEWMLVWKTAPRDFPGNFAIFIYDHTGAMVALAANVIGPDEDYSVHHRGGRYYLDIQASQPYVLSVCDRR